MSTINEAPAPVKPRRSFQQREDDRLALEARLWDAKTPEEQAARRATLKARGDAATAKRRAEEQAESEAREAAERGKVGMLDWAHTVSADPHACPRLREWAMCIMNDGTGLNDRFHAPTMSPEEQIRYDESKALVAVGEGRASYRPAASGFGAVKGLTDAERATVLGAEDAAREAYAARYATPSWDGTNFDPMGRCDADTLVRAIEVGKHAGRKALQRVLAARPRPVDPTPPDDRAEVAGWTASGWRRRATDRTRRDAIVMGWGDDDQRAAHGF